LLCTSKTL